MLGPLHLVHINHLAMVIAAFSIEECADARYRFVLVDEHSASLLSSGLYSSRAACSSAMEQLKMVLHKGIGIHILKTAHYNWFFVVMLNNKLLAQSRVYPQLERCEADADRVQALTPLTACAVEA